MKRICALCGQEFETLSSRRTMCYDDHFHACPICGVDVLTTDLYHTNTCCCAEHSRELAKQTTRTRFPNFEHISNPKSNAKRNEHNIFKTAEGQSFARARMLELHGVDNCSKLSEVIDKRKSTCMARYGAASYSASDVGKQAAKSRLAAIYGKDITSTLQLPEVKYKADLTNMSRYGSVIPMQNRKIWEKQRSGNKSRYSASDGTKLDSTYEVDVYEFCLRNNIPLQRNVPINYSLNGIQHTTYIDFDIDGILFEVKGEHILDGYFDDRGVAISDKLQVYRNNHVIVITGSSKSAIFGKSNSIQSNGLRYPDKCPNPLIGVDIELFRNPEFPYDKNKPRCFYDVKVDGQLSAFEAFQNEQIRWKMIKNRVEYAGGFIDAAQVLTAMNVTRTCKQPSWFSKSLAKKLIQKYCTSDVIVDPFAGWGSRADAAKELNKQYIGCDLNPDLVEWHHVNNRLNIVCNDARNFQFNDACSVFICPPYSDPITGRCFEDYNFDGFDASAKTVTQCQWLQIVMRNVPNAQEYVMVCKVVDPGWEKYIVDTKINKSHFGKNIEYVLVVPGTNSD